MHFIHEINWFECFLHKTSVVFQKFNFSRSSINRVCFLTDRKFLKFFKLGFAWFDWSSIGTRSIESVFRLIEPSSQLIEIFKVFIENFLLGSIGTQSVLDRSSFRWKEQKGPFPHVFFTFPKFYPHFSSFSSSTDPI